MMTGAKPSILEAIGGTPLVKLRRLGADVEADIYVKCEYLNPGGSMKDRMALRMVEAAERSGQLRPGGTIVEATSGNTGAALAMIAAVRGYQCIFVMPDKMSQEKIAALRAFGARVVVCPTAVEPDDPRSYYSVARRIAAETPNCFYANQYHNPANPEGHYVSTGPELWEQTGGEIDVFCAGLGTGGTITGTGRYLKERKPAVQLVGVDPVGSLYYDYVKTGRVTKPFTYKVEGIGEDFFPSTIDLKLLDEIVRVDDRECFLTTRDLVRLEGLYVGGSSGAAVAGALKYARQTRRKENIVVLLPDGASKYLSKIFNDDWMRENGFLDDTGLGVVADVLRLKPAEVITARSTDRVRDVIARMKAHGISQLPVVDDGKLIGAVAEVDLLRYLVSGEQSLDSPVGPLVESEYATVSPQTKVELLQGLLADARMAIVLDGEQIVGVITKIDLIDYLARRAS
ncbi:MAG: cystathionine beta-synthase [Myxococcota bacterium]|nr:cystathionine beta-synthase [Myxococcota bacterium]MDW8361948.1 cystathionine beta-synthase [Myxococcales bacterium]